MKKIAFLILLIIGILGWNYRDRILNWGKNASDFASSTIGNLTLNDLQREIITSGPLRSKTDAPNSSLTTAGVFEWTNKRRADNGLPPFKTNSQLDEAARLKVQDMFDQQYFDHVSPEKKGPSDLAETVHYEFIAVGENLALGNYKNDQALVEAWMNSPGHKANILSGKFQEMGVAVGRGMFEGKRTWLAVQEFGKPVSACPEINSTIKTRIDGLKAEADAMERELNATKAALEALEPKNKPEYDEYNRMASEYNAFVKTYNEKMEILKQLVNSYNAQVRTFNACAAK